MVIFYEKRLALALSRGEISERSSFFYLLIYLIISFLPTYLSVSYGEGNFTRVHYAIDILLTFVGTYVVYVFNVKGDNKDFIKRYIILSIPIIIKTAIIATCVYAIIYACFPVLVELAVLNSLIYFLLGVLLYGWLAYAMSIASGQAQIRRCKR